MGVVLRVRDRSLDRTLAMKRMLAVPNADSGDATAAKFGRFLEEAQITAQLDHPAIVPIHELGTDADGATYYTMKLVRGRELGEVFAMARRGEGGWNLPRALGVLVRVCQAVAFAHGKGVVHRDLKPANVMAGDLGEVYVMDWGLAKMTGHEDLRDIRLQLAESGIAGLQTIAVPRDDLGGALDTPLLTMDGAVVGTPAYMPPEQAAGRVSEVDHQSDLYALGAMLYELVAGQPPYMPAGQRTTAREVLSRILTAPPERIRTVNKNADPELAAICEKAMAREKSDRYATAVDLAEDVQAYLDGRVVAAYEQGAWAEMRKWVRRNRGTAIAGAAAIVVALVGLGATIFIQSRAAEKQRVLLENEQGANNRARLGLADSFATIGLGDAEKGDYGRAELRFTEAAALCFDDPVREHLNRTRALTFSARATPLVRALSTGTFEALSFEFHPGNRWAYGRGDGAQLYDLEREEIVPFAKNCDALAWHPDGVHVAMAKGGELGLWHLEKRTREKVLKLPPTAGPSRNREKFTFSGDGRWLCAAGSEAWLCDAREWRVLETNGPLPGPWPGPPSRVQFAPDGALLVATDHDARIFDLSPEGRATPRFSPVPHAAERHHLRPALDAAGKRFFTMTGERQLTLWDAKTGAELSRTTTPGNAVSVRADLARVVGYRRVTAIPGGETVMTGDFDGDTLAVSRFFPDGSLLFTNNNHPQVHREGSTQPPRALGSTIDTVHVAGISGDGTLALTFERNHLLRLWRVEPEPALRLLPCEGRSGLAFSADGRHVALTGSVSIIHPLPHVGRVFTLPDFTASPPLPCGGVLLGAQFLDETTLVQLCSARRERDSKQTFLSASESGVVQFWDWRAGRRRHESSPLPSEPRAMCALPGQARLLVLCSGGHVVSVDAATGAVTPVLQLPESNDTGDNDYGGFGLIHLTPDARTLVVWLRGWKNPVHVFDWPAARERHAPIPMAVRARNVTVQNGKLLLLGDGGGRVYDLASGQLFPAEASIPMTGWPSGARFSADGATLLLSGAVPGIKQWNWRTARVAGPDLPAQNWTSAEYIHGTPWLLTAWSHRDNLSVQFWDAATAQPVAPEFFVPTHAIRDPQLTPDGRFALLPLVLPRPGIGVLDLAILHARPTLPPESLAQLARLNAGGRLRDGAFVKYNGEEFLREWQTFRKRHPEFHRLK